MIIRFASWNSTCGSASKRSLLTPQRSQFFNDSGIVQRIIVGPMFDALDVANNRPNSIAVINTVREPKVQKCNRWVDGHWSLTPPMFMITRGINSNHPRHLPVACSRIIEENANQQAVEGLPSIFVRQQVNCFGPVVSTVLGN